MAEGGFFGIIYVVMELEELIGKFAANAGIENVQAVEGVWKFSADGNL